MPGDNIKYVYKDGDFDDLNQPKTKATDRHEIFIKVKTQQDADKLIKELEKSATGRTHVFFIDTLPNGKIVVRGNVKGGDSQ